MYSYRAKLLQRSTLTTNRHFVMRRIDENDAVGRAARRVGMFDDVIAVSWQPKNIRPALYIIILGRTWSAFGRIRLCILQPIAMLEEHNILYNTIIIFYNNGQYCYWATEIKFHTPQ